MYKFNSKTPKTTLKVNTSYVGETIEQKIRRIVNNKEPISDGAPLIYTERKDGIRPEYDIRTDRFEIAIDAMDKVTKAHLAKRESTLTKKPDGYLEGPEAGKGGETKGGETGGQSTGATT